MLFRDEIIVAFKLRSCVVRDEYFHYHVLGTSRELFGDSTQKNTNKKKEDSINSFDMEFGNRENTWDLYHLEGYLEYLVEKKREER